MDNGLKYHEVVQVNGDRITFQDVELKAASKMKNPYRVTCGIGRVTEKAIQIEIQEGYLENSVSRHWIPKSQCGWLEISGFWPELVVEKWLVAQNNLWQ